MSPSRRWNRVIRVLPVILSVVSSSVTAQTSSYEQLQTFSGILNQIRLNYVDSVTYTGLVHAAIDGVLQSLDPHSYFLSRDQGLRNMQYEAGQLAGLGIYVTDVDGLPTVQAVLPQSPAAKSGVAIGDRIVRVNDTMVIGLPFQTLQDKLIGEKGSKIRLQLERGTRLEPDSLRITLKYDFLEPNSVTAARMLDRTTGYLRLQQFYPKASEEVENALKKLKSGGATRIVFDIRGNPGGVVFSAVEIASLFFPESTLVFRTVGRRSAVNQRFVTEKNGRYRDLGLILLIDEGSASAAEALAGSLQDHDRALLMGRRSFGKALMQRAFEVPPAGDVVWLTIGHVLTPSGRFIQRRYQGLREVQYYSFAGHSGAGEDTTAEFHTDDGRLERGGGGILPDVLLPGRTPLPVWFSAAADSGFHDAISDSVAGTLGTDQASLARFTGNSAQWQQVLVDPFLNRVRQRLHVVAQPDSLVAARIGRILAARVIEVRWGSEALEDFLLKTDPDVQSALTYFPRLAELLAKH